MVLEDVLEPGLKVVFCGTAVGTKSAQDGAYYAGRGNKFWEILFDIRLTPYMLDPGEYLSLPKYGIGLTDLVKIRSGKDSQLSQSDFDVEGFRSKIIGIQPKAVAFNGKKAAKEFYELQSTTQLEYGRQPELIGRTAIFVLPSTSGSARRYWDETCWDELAKFLIKFYETSCD